MTQYDNQNRGAIWKNEKKTTENHPDFTGSLNVGGVDYWVSAWKRKPDAKPTAPALSFAIKPKDQRQDTHNQAKSDGYQKDQFDDDIGF